MKQTPLILLIVIYGCNSNNEKTPDSKTEENSAKVVQNQKSVSGNDFQNENKWKKVYGKRL